MRFHIVSPTFNAEDFIGEAIASVRAQTHGDFRHTVVDDLSTDATVARALDAMGDDDRFRLVRNDSKHFALGSCWRGIEASGPSEDEVVIVLDGDDRLADARVLERLELIYADPDCWMTYGSFTDMDGVLDKDARPYAGDTVRHALFRRRRCGVPHLRTFRYGLWRRIPWPYFGLDDTDVRAARRRALMCGRWRRWWHWRGIKAANLLDPSGRFPRRLCDKVPTYAMLEMAREHARFVPEVLLHYRKYGKDLGFPAAKRRYPEQKWFTRLTRDIVEHRVPLARLEDASSRPSRAHERGAPVGGSVTETA